MKRSKVEDCPFLRLSEKLTLEILYRLPAKSLGRCKLVCKSWKTLISDPEFALSHVQFWNNNHEPLTLILQKNNILSLLKFRDPTDIRKGVTLAPLKRRFLEDGLFDDPKYRFIVGSCDGLICVYVKETGKKRRRDDSMSLWNPLTTEELEVSLPVVQRGSFYVHIESSWFGCLPSCDDDYKIFLVYTMYKPARETCMYLYSLRNDRWTDVSREEYDCISGVDSVFLDETLHYLVDCKWIVTFCLISKTFKKVPLSIKADLMPKYHQLSLGVIGEYECLCAMFVHRSDEEWTVELWTLEEYGIWDSWEKMYRIELQENIVINCIQFLGFTYDGNLCIQQANGLVLVDTDDDPPSHVVARNPSFEKVYKVMDYVESLVSPESIP